MNKTENVNVLTKEEVKTGSEKIDFKLKFNPVFGDLVESNFWSEINNEKMLFKLKKEKEILEKIEDLKKNKRPIGEVLLDFKDYSSLFMFLSMLMLVGLFQSSIYMAYVILPIVAYFLGKNVLPKKIKVIDKKAISELSGKIEELSLEGFENELASVKLLNTFKRNYGEKQLEQVFIDSIKNQKEKTNFKLIEKFEPDYKVSISQLINAAKNLELNADEMENIKTIVEKL